MSQPTPHPAQPIRRAAARCALLLGAAALALSTLCMTAPPAYGATGSLSVGSEIPYANWSTSIFSVNGNEAFCGEPDQETPGAGSYAMEPISDRLVAAALWYGYGGPGFSKGLWPQSYYNGSAMNANEYRVLTHVALVYLRTGDVNYACINTRAAFKSWCEQNVFGAAADGTVLNANAICQRIKGAGFTIDGASATAAEFPKGFSAYRFSTGAGTQAMFTSSYVPHGWVELTKASSIPSLTEGNRCYNLEGAEYGIYEDEACTRLVATLTTDADGCARSELMPSGTYYLKETSAPEGYALSEGVTSVRVPDRAAGKAEPTDVPQSNLVDLCVRKNDLETSQARAQGGAQLGDAEYLVRFFGGAFATVEEAESAGAPLRSWTIRTGEDGCAYLDEGHLASGDDLFRDADGNPCLPLGTVVVTESKAPFGYLLGSEAIVCAISAEGTAAHVSTFAVPDHYEQVIRGDLAFVKVREADQRPLAGIPFLLTSLSTGESHLLVTDGNGEASTAAAHASHEDRTNANDEALNRDGTVDESKLDASAGIWFGTGRPSDEHGALICDKYRIEELPCSANEGLELITLPSVAITRDGHAFDMGTLSDQPAASMFIRTTARDGVDGDKEMAPDGEVTIVDRVEYHDVAVGQDYLMWGTLVQRSTGEAVLDEHGSAVMAQMPFTPEEANGFVELEFPVDASAYAGEDIVVCEDLIDAETGATITSDFDLDNYEETVHVASVVPDVPADQAKIGKTGDGNAIGLATLGVVVAAGGAAWAWRRRRLQRERRERAQRLMANLMR